MRILRVFDGYKDSALGYFLMDRIIMQNSPDYQMQVVYLDKKSGKVPDEYKGVKFHHFSEKKIKWFSIPTVFKLAGLIKQEKIDIVHCDHYKALVYTVFASFFCKDVRIIVMMHAMNRCRGWQRRLFFKLFAHKIDKLLGCSKRLANDIKTYPSVKEEQVIALDNSIDCQKYASAKVDYSLREKFGFSKGDFVFINVCRLVETKGLEYLLEAFEIVSKEYNKVKLLIVGEGRLKEHLEALAPKGVVFAGFRTDVAELMKVSDCFVLSSIREAFGNVITEAMSAGLPVVSTTTGAVEQIEDDRGNKFGFLCPIADSKALAKSMKEAMGMDENTQSDLIGRAKKRVEDNYSHQRAVENLKRLYNDVYLRKEPSSS